MDPLFVIAMAVLLSTASPAKKAIAGAFDARHLTGFLLGEKGRNYLLFVNIVTIPCWLALIAWGFLNMKWYFVIIGFLVASLVSPLADLICTLLVRSVVGEPTTATNVFRNLILMFGWLPCVGLTVWLWLR